MSADPDTRRSASGARQGGDEYQHLVAWNKILMARHNGLVRVELEAVGAGNADDVVIHFENRPSEYAQVRYAVDGSSPLNTGYLTQSRESGTSVAQKFLATWRGPA